METLEIVPAQSNTLEASPAPAAAAAPVETQIETPRDAPRGIGLFGSIGLTLLSQLIVIPFVIPLAAARVPRSSWIFGLTIGASAVLGLVSVAWMWMRAWKVTFRDQFPADRRLLRWVPWVAAAAISYLMVILGSFSLLSARWPWFAEAAKKIKLPIEGPAAVLILLGVFLIPFAEELLFRGVILRGMLRRYSARTAILLSAALFAVLHGYLIKMPVVFVFAVGVSVLYAGSRSLWLPVLAHVVNNSILIPVALFGKQDSDFLLPVPYAAVMFVAGTAMIFFAGRRLYNLHWAESAEHSPAVKRSMGFVKTL